MAGPSRQPSAVHFLIEGGGFFSTRYGSQRAHEVGRDGRWMWREGGEELIQARASDSVSKSNNSSGPLLYNSASVRSPAPSMGPARQAAEIVRTVSLKYLGEDTPEPSLQNSYCRNRLLTSLGPGLARVILPHLFGYQISKNSTTIPSSKQ